MPEVPLILGRVDAHNPARDEGPHLTATALRMMDESILVWPQDPDRGAELADDAAALFGGGVLLALQDMQIDGKLPPPGTDAWDKFVAQAEAGDVAIGVVILLRGREPASDLGPSAARAWPGRPPLPRASPRLRRSPGLACTGWGAGAKPGRPGTASEAEP